ncbi:MAG: hypothetical protein L0206_05080 [Actinobacteria bacterium]|nr:hypothetical protein [Actinomycetota bacterium]
MGLGGRRGHRLDPTFRFFDTTAQTSEEIGARTQNLVSLRGGTLLQLLALLVREACLLVQSFEMGCGDGVGDSCDSSFDLFGARIDACEEVGAGVQHVLVLTIGRDSECCAPLIDEVGDLVATLVDEARELGFLFRGLAEEFLLLGGEGARDLGQAIACRRRDGFLDFLRAPRTGAADGLLPLAGGAGDRVPLRRRRPLDLPPRCARRFFQGADELGGAGLEGLQGPSGDFLELAPARFRDRLELPLGVALEGGRPVGQRRGGRLPEVIARAAASLLLRRLALARRPTSLAGTGPGRRLAALTAGGPARLLRRASRLEPAGGDPVVVRGVPARLSVTGPPASIT